MPLSAEASAAARGAAELPGWRVVSSENDEALAGYWAELGRATGGALHGRPMAPGFVDYHTRTIYLPPAGRANAR